MPKKTSYMIEAQRASEALREAEVVWERVKKYMESQIGAATNLIKNPTGTGDMRLRDLSSAYIMAMTLQETVAPMGKAVVEGERKTKQRLRTRKISSNAFESFLRSERTGFEIHELSEDSVVLSAREGAGQEPSREHFLEGKRLKKELKKQFPSWSWRLSIVDEWIMLMGKRVEKGAIGHLLWRELESLLQKRFRGSVKQGRSSRSLRIKGTLFAFEQSSYGGRKWIVERKNDDGVAMRRALATTEKELFDFIDKQTRKTGMTSLKDQLIRLGAEKPELQKDIKPVLDALTSRKASRLQWNKVTRGGKPRWSAATGVGAFFIHERGSQYTLELHVHTNKRTIGGPYRSVEEAKKAAEDYEDFHRM